MNWTYSEVPNDLMSPLFQAAIEMAEAIYNSHWMAETMTGYHGVKVVALPFSFVENR